MSCSWPVPDTGFHCVAMFPLFVLSQLFREAMLSMDFQEIHTPKLIAGASEGGAAVFR